jgi:hypothetical protein
MWGQNRNLGGLNAHFTAPKLAEVFAETAQGRGGLAQVPDGGPLRQLGVAAWRRL